MRNWNDEWDDEDWREYVRTVNAAYWEEEGEMKLGIHPSQTQEKLGFRR